ncbi:MAG: putative porin [Muribaculaceae bacterium]|nr:putative porin [Muribaculaceae bacterium]
MKKLILTIYLLCGIVIGMEAAKKPQLAPSYAWKASNPLGLRLESTIDTLFENYCRRSIPSAVSDEWASTGNLGAEGMNMIWSDRQSMSDFYFRDALSAWLPSEQTMKYYNSRVPMTLLSYNASGGRETAQERLTGHFSGNINRRAQVGALLDYLYSKGSYANQAVKNLTWGASGSYMGDRYEFQGFYNHYNSLNKENGGITDDRYITDPAALQGGVSSINSKSIPTRLTDAHTKYVGGQLWMNHRYKVGHWHEEQLEGDTVVRRTYIPVMSFIWTMDYSFGKHLFLNGAPGEATNFFDNTYFSSTGTRDVTKYQSVTNTVGVSMLEGFSKWAKFGLAAYATYQYRKYTQTPDTMLVTGDEMYTPLPEFYSSIDESRGQSLLWVGAQLTKQRGSILRYDVTGELGVVGQAAGDVKVFGTVDTRFRLLGDTVGLTAYGHFKNIHAPYLMNNYRSNHFIWHNDFGKTRSLRAGGRLDIGHTGTLLDVGVENVQNHIYFGPDCLPVQHGGSVQVFTARLEQKLRVGILHWDNRLTYQTTSDDAVISLPKFGVYTNLYLLFRIATLKVQLGVDCDYYTSYYAPGYQPATMGFYNQREVKVGNYPFMNVYANMKLSKARFYVLFSHINQGWMGNEYFSLPHYPMNPRRFQIGVSVDFAN